MSRVIVFGGPSLPHLGRISKVVVRPPAARGELLSVSPDSGNVVVFLDGLFFHTASPTHRDLLQLLQSGVRTIGASSMGALRAAELRDYGMVGIGIVYEAVVAGIVTDDSEVAVGLSPYDFMATTVPLINVRRLLAIARQQGIDELAARQAFDLAKSVYFLNRTKAILRKVWSALLGEVGLHLCHLLEDGKRAKFPSGDEVIGRISMAA